jgi:hypothetical protein
MILEQIKTIKEKVKSLLENNPHLRDNDFKLIANFYFFEIGPGISKMSAMQFLDMFANGKLSHSESIRRARQKIQEDNPNLRGKSYAPRNSDAKTFRKEVKNL